MGIDPKVFGALSKIVKSSNDEEGFGTGLVGEKLVIAGYRSMKIKDLESLRFIINKIIKQKTAPQNEKNK